jgi:hypothetical protein
LKKVDFKNVQRRVYDALNVLNAMDIIRKDRNNIYYNPKNTIIDDSQGDDEASAALLAAEKQRVRERQLQ